MMEDKQLKGENEKRRNKERKSIFMEIFLKGKKTKNV